MEQKYDTNWIWTPNWTYEDDLVPSFVYFRKEFILSKLPEEGIIEISADSRYKLYVNDSFIQAGPSKGDRETWYYDEADIIPYLREGKNVIAVEVLRYPEELSKRNYSLYRGQFPGLYVNGFIKSNEEEVDVSGKSGFKCYKTDHIKIVGENVNPAPLHISEEVEGDSILHVWKK